MNINFSIHSLSNQAFELIQEKGLPFLSPLHRKIAALALAILACAAVSTIVYLRCFKATKGKVEEEGKKGLDHPESLLSVTSKPEPDNCNARFLETILTFFEDRTYFKEEIA